MWQEVLAWVILAVVYVFIIAPVVVAMMVGDHIEYFGAVGIGFAITVGAGAIIGTVWAFSWAIKVVLPT